MPEYHLRRKDKEIGDEAEVAGILSRCRLAAIGLCRGGEPYVVTMDYGYDAARKALYFHCAREGQKIDFLQANPSVCVSIVEDLGYKTGECSHAYRSLTVRGRMAVVDATDEKMHGLSVLIRHLEKDPEPLVGKFLKDEKAVAAVGILRLDVVSVTAKAGS